MKLLKLIVKNLTSKNLFNIMMLKPKLRFSEFDNNQSHNEYIKHPFKDIFSFSSGKNIKQGEASPEYETPCVRYGELYHLYGEVIYEIINKTYIDKSELTFSQGNEILLPSAGEEPIGISSASALIIKNVAIGRTINVLRPIKEGVYSQIYASFYINYKLKKDIALLARGVSISNVYNTDLKKLNIILPSLKEQQKIDSFLTSFDNKINLLTKKKELLEQYKKGVMQKIFSQEIRFKNDNGDDFPDWKLEQFSDVIKLIPSKQIKNSNMLNRGRHIVIEQGKKETLSYSDDNSLLYKNDGAIIFGDHTTEIKYINFDFVPGPSIKILKSLKNDNINYLYYSLSFNNIKPEGYKRHYSILKQIYLNVPSNKEQIKIAKFLSSIDKKINLVNTQIDKTKEFKKGLLQQMFV